MKIQYGDIFCITLPRAEAPLPDCRWPPWPPTRIEVTASYREGDAASLASPATFRFGLDGCGKACEIAEERSFFSGGAMSRTKAGYQIQAEAEFAKLPGSRQNSPELEHFVLHGSE